MSGGGQRRSEVGRRRAEARRCPYCGRGGGLIGGVILEGWGVTTQFCRYSRDDKCWYDEDVADAYRQWLRARVRS